MTPIEKKVDLILEGVSFLLQNKFTDDEVYRVSIIERMDEEIISLTETEEEEDCCEMPKRESAYVTIKDKDSASLIHKSRLNKERFAEQKLDALKQEQVPTIMGGGCPEYNKEVVESKNEVKK